MNPNPEIIRKAAIVIASLDEQSADKLLESMPEELASQIRWMSIELEDIDEQERQRVLDEFLANTGRGKPPLSDDVETEFTYAAPDNLPVPKLEGASNNTPEPPPFGFLNDAPTEMLAPFFEQEHPQVSAVMLSFLPPRRVAEILKHLGIHQQADIVQRISQLDEPNREVVAELEARAQKIVSQQMHSFKRRQAGVAAAQAILRMSSLENADHLRKELAERGFDLPEVVTDASETFYDQVSTYQAAFPTPAEKKTEIITDRKLDEPPPAPMEKPNEIKPGVEPPQPLPKPPRVPNFAFERLPELDDQALAQVLHGLGPKIVLLALCGAPEPVVARIGRGLGAKEMKRLEQKIRELQPVLLSDIDRAQRVICLAVDDVLADRQKNSPSSLLAAA